MFIEFVNEKDKKIYVSEDKISFIEPDGDYVWIHTVDRKIVKVKNGTAKRITMSIECLFSTIKGGN